MEQTINKAKTTLEFQRLDSTPSLILCTRPLAGVSRGVVLGPGTTGIQSLGALDKSASSGFTCGPAESETTGENFGNHF